MSKLTGPSAYNLPMPVFPFIKSEPKEPEQKSHFFPHIKYLLSIIYALKEQKCYRSPKQISLSLCFLSIRFFLPLFNHFFPGSTDRINPK